MIKAAMKYGYPTNGNYAETVATLADGRLVTIDTQYGCVTPHGQHADGCAQVTQMGGVCDCGLLAGIDTAALVADARANGLRGRAPVAVAPGARARGEAILAREDAREARIYRAMV